MTTMEFDISWTITRPLKKAIFTGPIKMAGKLDGPENVSVVILYDPYTGKPNLVEKLQENTLICLLETIESNMNKLVPKKKFIKKHIAQFFDPYCHELMEMYENDTLKIKDIIGNHNHFNGNIELIDNVWHYKLDS